MHKGWLLVMGALLGLALAACRSGAEPVAVSGDGWAGVIFPASAGEAFEGASGLRFAEYWTPTEEQVAQLEAALPDYLAQSPPPQSPELGVNLGQYERQYIGVVEGEQRLLYANFFCEAHGQNSRQGFIFVDDGGDCYFQVMFDPVSATFSGLHVNGEA